MIYHNRGPAQSIQFCFLSFVRFFVFVFVLFFVLKQFVTVEYFQNVVVLAQKDFITSKVVAKRERKQLRIKMFRLKSNI